MLKASVPIVGSLISLCANRHASKSIEDDAPVSLWGRWRVVLRCHPAGTAVGVVCQQS